MVEKKEISNVLQARLEEAFSLIEENPTAFCKKHDIDRNTFAQIASSDSFRLPRADTITKIARALNVSADWLLGLSEDKEHSAQILRTAVETIDDVDSPTAEDIWINWHDEIGKSKVRTIPVTIPVPFKTKEYFIEEYSEITGRDRAEEEFEKLLKPPKDYEIVLPFQNLIDLAHGGFIYNSFPEEIRHAQLDHLASCIDEHYPSCKFYLFNALDSIVAPFTIFGYTRVAVYIDEKYLVYNTEKHIEFFSEIFDGLIASTVVHPHEVSDYIRSELLK